LPAGVLLNTVSGVISGTPTAAATQATYTITAMNAGGSTSFQWILTVNPLPTVTSVTVACNPTTVQGGQTSQCSATVQGTGNFNSSVAWSADVGSVNSSNGLYTAPDTAGTATVKATSVQTSTQSGSAALTVTVRASIDRPDDVQGNQVHVLYVIPSDGTDNSYDLDGSIATSVAAWEQWFAGQASGSRVRLDTFNGAVDITFVKLGRTNAQMQSYGVHLRDQLEYELLTLGFTASNKNYLAYFDGGGIGTEECGGAALPPSLPGTVSAIYLNGMPIGAPACDTQRFATSAKSPGYLEFAALHDTLHALGVVPSCAPHFTLFGHVSDNNTDLMYSGSLPWMPSVLDFNHDDYYRANIPGCLDLSRSDFLDPLPQGAESPPGRPYTTLQTISCASEGTVHSTGTSANATNIEFANGTGNSANIYWLDGTGARQLYKTLAPFEGYIQPSFVGDYWVATNTSGQCTAIYSGAWNLGRAILH
jgi:hypothetical protein